jgi:hypothetical protein
LIVYQIAASGGKAPIHFQEVIAQSPGCNNNAPGSYMDLAYAAFLRNLNVTTLDEAHAVPWEEVWAANNATIGSGGGYSRLRLCGG